MQRAREREDNNTSGDVQGEEEKVFGGLSCGRTVQLSAKDQTTGYSNQWAMLV